MSNAGAGMIDDGFFSPMTYMRMPKFKDPICILLFIFPEDIRISLWIYSPVFSAPFFSLDCIYSFWAKTRNVFKTSYNLDIALRNQ